MNVCGCDVIHRGCGVMGECDLDRLKLASVCHDQIDCVTPIAEFDDINARVCILLITMSMSQSRHFTISICKKEQHQLRFHLRRHDYVQVAWRPSRVPDKDTERRRARYYGTRVVQTAAKSLRVVREVGSE